MKKLLMLSLLLVLVSSFSIQAQDQAAMQQWQEYSTPGAMHKLLAEGVGQWKCEFTYWMDPAQPPTKYEGTATCEALLDGRYYQTKYSATMMGMPYIGIELVGYDNAKKKFFSSWIDNMGTGIMNLEGTYDESTKSLTLSGTATDYNGKEIKTREVMKTIDENTSTFEFYIDMGKGETKSLEGKYTRIKS